MMIMELIIFDHSSSDKPEVCSRESSPLEDHGRVGLPYDSNGIQLNQKRSDCLNSLICAQYMR
jgi:hypothetical protein